MAPSPRRLASALSRDPRASIMPVQGGPGRPKFPPTQSSQPQPQPLTRLSPGVYRDASGALVNQQGGMLPNQPQRGGMAQPMPTPEGIYGGAGTIPGARQDMLQIPPNVPPMPKGGQNMQNMGQQLARDAYIMNQIRTGNIPQMPGNNMISRGVNEATRNLYAQAQDKYAQQQQPYMQPNPYAQFGPMQPLVGVQPSQMTPEQMAAITQEFGFNQAQMPQQMQQMQPGSPAGQMMQPQIRRY